MPNLTQDLQKQMKSIVEQCKSELNLRPNQVLVIGCSTSEVIGQKIGTAGSMDVARIIFEELQNWSKQENIALAFQCCEHLNRALVVERRVTEEKGWEEVTVIPVPEAGGSMATYAYEHFEDPVVVEFIKADAGIDIGDTFIGMHLKHVVVPVRIEQKNLGEARVTIARTRPKLIGGERAIYRKQNNY